MYHYTRNLYATLASVLTGVCLQELCHDITKHLKIHVRRGWKHEVWSRWLAGVR